MSAATAGVLLAVGAATFFASSLGSARLIRRGSCRTVAMWSGLGMSVVIAVQFGLPVSTEVSLASFCLVAVFAGVRTADSATLGLAQLPAQPGAMMAARKPTRLRRDEDTGVQQPPSHTR